MPSSVPAEIALFYRQMRDTSTVLAFSGAVSQEIVVGLAETLREKLGRDADDPRLGGRVFAAFVELAPNVLSHSAERVPIGGRDVGAGIVLIRESSDRFVVLSGNPAERSAAEALAERCRTLAATDPTERRRLRREQLRGGAPGRGAGLGLLEVAQLSGHAVGVHAEPFEDRAFVVVEVRLDKEATGA